MSRFPSEEVARVAALARIALTEEEIDRLSGELEIIAEAVAKVSEVPSDTPATSHPLPLTNVMRPDVVGAVLDRDQVLAAAPAAEAGQFAVPQILEED